MLRPSCTLAMLIALTAAPALAEGSPFDGVWQVQRRGPPQQDSATVPAGRPGPGMRPGAGARPGTGARLDLPEALAAQLGPGDRRIFSQMTPEGQARFAAFDPDQLPANNCRSPGLPSIAMTPNLQAWTVGAHTLSIHHEYFDTHREISLDAAPAPAGTPTEAGQATGRIQGDRIDIETTGLAPAWGGLARNAPSSDARVVHETYRLDGPDTLRGQIEIRDPKYLKAPIRLEVVLRRAPAGTEIVTFPCDLEASRRHLADTPG